MRHAGGERGRRTVDKGTCRPFVQDWLTVITTEKNGVLNSDSQAVVVMFLRACRCTD